MGTPNLDLQTIEMSDNLKTDFVRKINSNMQTIDDKYGELKDLLLQKTGKNTLESAIEYVELLVNAQDATATSDKIFKGYTAYKGTEKLTGTGLSSNTSVQPSLLKNGVTAYDNNGNLITGNAYGIATTATASDIISGKTAYNDGGALLTGAAQRQPTINITATGTNISYIGNYGAGTDQDGKLVIWAYSKNTNYEHINFVATSIGVGTAGVGFGITSFDTSDPENVPYACVVTGVTGYDTINITLNASGLNSSYDYVTLQVTITAS